MFFLTPRYLKNAKLLHKGVTRFINYKRDILPAAKLAEIESLRMEFAQAMRGREKARLKELTEKLNQVCQRALPTEKRSDLGDNIEVFFVAIVIALGIRGYIAQPFKIPTGSMQPTLNGIIVERTEEDPRPALPSRVFDWFLGRSYVNVIADRDGTLDPRNPISESSMKFDLRRLEFGILSNYTVLNFMDGDRRYIKGPKNKVMSELGLMENLKVPTYDTGYRTPDEQPVLGYDLAPSRQIQIRKGQVLARGIVYSGDHVLVNKFSYHFRHPQRGEVFVFITKHIRGIEAGIPKEQGSQHYIKRLAGVPGDHLQIKSPQLWINGEVAREPGFQRVMSGVDGFRGYADARVFSGMRINEIQLGKEQYFALGDNSYNSSDSRVWGHVPRRNLVGPALFCYLPFTSHWGPIR